MVRWLLLVLVGCGRVDFDPLSDGGAAAGDGSTCAFGPWSNIVPASTLNGTGDEWEPALSPDGRTIVYVSYTGAAGLYAATRSSATSMFGAPRMLTELSTSNVEHGPAWSADGTKLYFSRELAMSQPMVADYLGDGMFGTPALFDVPSIGSAFALSADELEVFETVDNGSGDYDLLHATRPQIGASWVTGNGVLSLNTSGIEAYPAFDEPRGDLYYQRGSEIVVAHRAGKMAAFLSPAPAPGINVSGATTGDPSLTADGLTLAFSSTRPGGTGASDLYLATRVCR